jgi:hypothetical protein
MARTPDYDEDGALPPKSPPTNGRPSLEEA